MAHHTEPSSPKPSFAGWIRDWLLQVALDAELSPGASRIAIAISSYVNSKSWKAWPTQETIAAKFGCSVDTVYRHVADLDERGHLKLTGGRKAGYTYEPILWAPAETPQSCGDKINRKPRNPASDNTAKRPIETPQDCGIEHKEKEHSDRNTSLFEERDEAFAAFWTVYPKKVSQRPARLAFAKAIAKGVSADDIIQGARNYAGWAAGKAEADDTDRFIKHPANWLKDEGWTDEHRAYDTHGHGDQRRGVHAPDRVRAALEGIMEVADEARRKQAGEGPPMADAREPIEGQATVIRETEPLEETEDERLAREHPF